MTQPAFIDEYAYSDELLKIDIQGAPASDLAEWLEMMVLIREFEEACEPLALANKIPGGAHLAVGQEAVAVGAIRALRPTDLVGSTHRGHHHALAKGLTPRSIMAEIYGKATGCRGGRCGTMHLSDVSLGYIGGNGIVGAGIGIAGGAALAAHLSGSDQVAVAFVGEGGSNTGRVWESVNLAAIWRLPLIVICENNLYEVETRLRRAMVGESVARRASGFGLPAVEIDGQDVCAVYRETAKACQRARSGEGPTFIEALTYRYHGHNTGEKVTYRTDDEVELWHRVKDPILRLRSALEAAAIMASDDFKIIVARVRTVIADAIAFAEESPWPDAESALADVTGMPLHIRSNL